VYLHDTPAKELFERARRTFSHGCMRMEHPVDLAALLLRNQGWDKGAIESAIAAGRTLEIPLERPVAVWVLYLTAFMETDGTLHFREDVYGLDARGRIFEGLGAASAQRTSNAAQACPG
jgi:murein L,D-transpeptidase YcbB/YkuD